jgi:hypothetical protein
MADLHSEYEGDKIYDHAQKLKQAIVRRRKIAGVDGQHNKTCELPEHIAQQVDAAVRN